MEGKADDRSQPILRVPRDKTPVELILDDGERSYVLLYIAPGDRISQVFEDTSLFMPVTNGAGTRFVQRKAVACVTTNQNYAPLDHDLPQERQTVVVRLRGGTIVRGEMRWTAPYDRRRTQDHLNDASLFFLVFEADNVHFVAKSAVLSVEEL